MRRVQRRSLLWLPLMSPSKSNETVGSSRARAASTVSFAARSLSSACRNSGRCVRAEASEVSMAGTVVGTVRRIGDDDVARLVRADRVQQRQRRVLTIVLRHEQRLPRARELHIRLCNVEPRSGAGFELVLRRLQQAREERDVRLRARRSASARAAPSDTGAPPRRRRRSPPVRSENGSRWRVLCSD